MPTHRGDSLGRRRAHEQGDTEDTTGEPTTASDGERRGPIRDPLDMVHRPRDARPTQQELQVDHHATTHRQERLDGE